MWCPDCKTEYVEGITKCADCGIDLVRVLDEKVPSKETQEKLDRIQEKKESMDTIQPKGGSSLFIGKRNQYEDMKSSAQTFLIVGVLGIVALILIAFGIIPLHMASYMKIMMNLVMGALFLLFCVIGVISLKRTRTLKEEASDEERTTDEILTWFYSAYSSDSIDQDIPAKNDLSEEQLYFKRYEIMKDLFAKHFSDLDENYLEDLIERIYTKFYS